MPELPEVETIKSQISVKLPFEIKRVHLSANVGSILKQNEFDPSHMLIERIGRKGKVLDFELTGGRHILSGLGMSGTWLLTATRPTQKHCHIEFEGHASGGIKWLSYCDPRRFGLCYFVANESYQRLVDRIGVDISSRKFTTKYISKVLKRFPRRQLKVLLLDQKYFAGSGNYIANEICALAGIRPSRRAAKVTQAEVAKILTGTRKILKNSIASKGVSFHGGYKDTTGQDGVGLDNLVVFYQKTCGMCKETRVKKIVLAQRGTYYCPRCQK